MASPDTARRGSRDEAATAVRYLKGKQVVDDFVVVDAWAVVAGLFVFVLLPAVMLLNAIDVLRRRRTGRRDKRPTERGFDVMVPPRDS